ncbi:MAG: type II toxin-antitoxin system RelE/ParE family toxin [Chloroflexi bacterium]|nr:type II toxin-antitoxin system RelE/ParE family toxin [Chloroflexota bacterium]
MIKSFKDKEAERIFHRLFSRQLLPDIQRSALRRLNYLYSAKELTDLLIPPANRVEQLSGDRQRQHSIRINERWRICFEWLDHDAYNVEIVDYH